MFAEGARGWRERHSALAALSRPKAAQAIAARISAFAETWEPVPLPFRLAPVPA